MKTAIILAGGKGTRLGDEHPPKALLALNGKTLLDWQIEWLQGKVDRIVVALGHRCEEVLAHIKEKGYDVDISIEEEPLGTGGAVKQAFQKAPADKVYVLNVDNVMRVDVNEAFSQETPCILAKPVPYSVCIEGKMYPQKTASMHLGHTILSKEDVARLPDKGSLEQWLAGQNIHVYVHEGLWFGIDNIEELKKAELLWKYS